MMTVRHAILPLALLALLPPAVQADEAYWNGDRLQLRLGSFYVSSANSTVRFDSRSIVGVTLDSTQDLGMNSSDNIARLEANYRFNKTHSINLQWYDLERNGATNIGQEIEIGDPPETVPVGARVDSYLNTAIFKLGYNYSFYHNEKVELAVGGGLHIMDIELGVDGEVILGDPTSIASNNSSVTAPLPVLGGKIAYAVTPALNWVAAVDLFFIAVGGYEGQFIDTNLNLEWLFSRHLGIGGGLNSNSLSLRASPNTDNRFRLTNTINGIQTYLFLRF